MKRIYHTIRKQGKVNEQELTAFLVKNGQGSAARNRRIGENTQPGIRVSFQTLSFGAGISVRSRQFLRGIDLAQPAYLPYPVRCAGGH